MSANVFDLILIVIFAAFALFSYMRGAAKELATLVGLGAGFWAAYRFNVALGALITPIVRDRDLAELLAFVLIVALGYLVGSFVSGFGERTGRRPHGLVNSLAGAVVGLLKGLVVALALFWIIDTHITPFRDELAESRSAPYLARALELLADYHLL